MGRSRGRGLRVGAAPSSHRRGRTPPETPGRTAHTRASWARYARDERVLALEQAVHKMTGRVADRLGLGNRARLLVGQAADIVVFDVFDPATVQDRATFQEPFPGRAGRRRARP